jgi:hypothetical protein
MTEQTKSAPRRIKPEDIEAHVASEYYFTAAQGVVGVHAEVAAGDAEAGEQRPVQMLEINPQLRLVTFCVLVLRNGYTLVGSSACADEVGFDAEIGKQIARDDAIRKAWPIFGFLLVNQMALENALRDAETLSAQAQESVR